MTENATAADEAEAEARDSSVRARLRGLLRRFDPMRLGLLGLLAVPSWFVDSLAFLQVFGVFFLFFFWAFVGPVVDMVLARGAGEETEPTDWIGIGTWREYAVSYLMLPLTFLNPLVITQDLLQAFGGVVAFLRHRGSLPDAESYDQEVSYRLPVEGSWTVVNGSPEREYSHSWIYPNQRYAYDFLITDEDGRSRPEDANTAVENYYCYDEPVLAPADGVVVETFDTALEASRGGGFSHPLKRSIPGGHVVIEHAASEYSFLAHLRPGSVTVNPGQRLERGQQVGRCGHSGNSSEPHLHFQVQDTPDFATAASLPVRFDDVETDSPGVSHEPDLVPGHDVWHSGSPDGSPDGYHSRTFVVEGQRVAHAEQAGGEKNLAREVRSVDADADATDNPADDRTNLGDVSAGWVTSTLKRAAYALAVAGVLAYAGGWVTSALTVAGILAGASVAAPAYRYAVVFLRGSPSGTRTGWLGTPLGFALGAAVVALQAWSVASLGVGLAAVGGALLLAGFLGHVAVGVYEGIPPRDLSSESVAS